MTSFFEEMFAYNYHFNQKLAITFAEHSDKISQRAMELMSHILNVHQIWNNRINSKQTPFGIWELHSIQDFQAIDQTNYSYSLTLLEYCDWSERFHYQNSKGKDFDNSIRDAFFHIINHSTYHRGQIATEFRQNGLKPLITDYAIYKRDMK